MSKLEIVLFVVALVNVGVVVELVRRRELNEGFALLWIGFGVAGIGLAVARPLVDRVARELGVAYGANFWLAGGILFLAFVAMSLSLHVSRLESKVESLAQEIAFLRGPEGELSEPERQPG